MTADATRPSRARWDELDLLRGVAGVLMVVNHTGYKWLSPLQLGDAVIAALVFAGSCAPVVFFAASGVGYGLGAGTTRPPDRLGLLRKVAILLAADALLWLTPSQPYGLDFLGFIGLSMLALDPLRHAKHGLRWALAGIAVVSILRFGVGEVIKGWPPGATTDALRVALGVEATAGISYPLLPWLAYGLTGFVVGAVAKDARAWVDRRLPWVLAGLLALVAINAGATAVLLATGRSVHRWGYVSLGFYFVGFAAIAGALALALAATRWGGRAARGVLELRGIASLALVPLHYAAIALVASLVAVASLQRWTWIAATVLTLALAFAAARAVERGVTRATATPRPWLPGALLLGVAAAFAAKLALVGHAGTEVAVLVVVTIGQVLLCARFAVDGAAKPARAPSA